jgi:hypothetical protein
MARIVNFFAGPGVGKSMTAAALFAELKYQGHNTELISEFAKEAAWEGRGASFFDAQTYIAGVQGYKIDSVIGKVDFAITDSPMLQNLVYIPENYPAPSLRNVLREHHDAVESINILLQRTMPYDPRGRYQDANQAEDVAERVYNMLIDQGIIFTLLETSRKTPFEVIEIMKDRGWIPNENPTTNFIKL